MLLNQRLESRFGVRLAAWEAALDGVRNRLRRSESVSGLLLAVTREQEPGELAFTLRARAEPSVRESFEQKTKAYAPHKWARARLFLSCSRKEKVARRIAFGQPFLTQPRQ